MKCSVIHELDSLQSAKYLSVSLQLLESRHKNTSTDENTLPQNTEKPERGVLQRKEDFFYNSVDMDVAEMQAGNSHVQYPKFRLFEKVASSIAKLYAMMHKMSSAITDLSINVKQLLSKSNEREKPHQFDCGLSSQQFPLSSEEELQMPETGLQQKETRHRFASHQH
ncbi:unnamed protein product [Schistosoma curassoni]|uniref:Focal_AT domain-containing protein n=1 Tax=Schistosoma curassoni TaxID=6186 RepID=A0A183JL97_9TREM|nr:unnamed protein product [Schistosoma curassoni]